MDLTRRPCASSAIPVSSYTKQMARDLIDAVDGFLLQHTYVIMDRDPLSCLSLLPCGSRRDGKMRRMSRTTLVTGAAGFIGAHVARHCQALGQRVVGLDDLSGGFRNNVPADVEFVEGDITDASLVARLFAEHRFSHVYHLAAYAAEGLSHFIRRYNYRVNVHGSINLINEAIKHDVQCFVFASSIAVYGEGQTPMTEELVPTPEDPYGIAKYAVELDLKAAHKMFGLPYIVFRPHNVYGELQNIADRYRNVIGIFMNQVMREQPMTIFGDGLQTRAFSHVDDVAPIIARAPSVASAYNQVFNVGADQPYSVLELAQQVARAFDVPARVEHLAARNEVVHAFSDHNKVAQHFGTRTQVSLEQGIARMASWVKAHGARNPVVFKDIEIRKNLPPSWSI
ncbi:MAG TPA: NAD-dependent epimerase/dehydratase family protein [Polyangiales bacterium]|nr:NAD-dependent epimerase/dehydratase family protein [Polyangiales bacterium]